MTTEILQTDVAIIGGGPTGLTAAYRLRQSGLGSLTLEKRARVGGIARTEQYRGYYIDIGGHRLYTKVEAIEQLWREILGDDLLERPRLSRIYYNGQFFHYPIRPFETLGKLGPVESGRIALSYLGARLFPHRREDSFEQWVSNRFGRRLYEIFFKTYTEKVWGIPCHQLKAEWAAQRIKGLSLPVALWNSLPLPRRQPVKTLIHTFLYPRLGPGMLWETMQERLEEAGHRVLTGHEVIRLHCEGNRLRRLTVRLPDGRERTIEATEFISTMPLADLIPRLRPLPPPDLLAAAEGLIYRDFLTVALIVERADLFPDNWLYIHSPQVRVGRIQNFKNWSPDMVPDPATSCLGLEYFCNVGDELWEMADADLIELGRREAARLGLLAAADVIDGVVFRQPKAYPVYTGQYQAYVEQLKAFIDSIPNLQSAGRNGLHRYNNQDHSMLTGLLAARNILDDQHHDVWAVNTEQAYHEEAG